MLYSFYMQVTDIVPTIKLLYMNYDIRYHNVTKFLKDPVLYTKVQIKSENHILNFVGLYS